MVLYIDSREPQDVIDMFKRRNLAVEVRHIESGDYIIGNLAIERKTIQDLVNSVTSGDRHLWSQLETMCNTYEQQILLIEGNIDYNDRLLMGILTSIILFWKYQTIFSKDKKETALWIERLYTKYGIGKTSRIPPVARIRARTTKEIKSAMLQQIDGIGPVMANKILEQIPEIFNQWGNDDIQQDNYKLSIERELRQIKGLNKESKKILIEVLTE